ncbi:MAG: transposase [Candidatus Paceibacterota bacterium]
MVYRKFSFANEEVIHAFNRGVDKRDIFLDKFDLERFFISMLMFNSIAPSGSIYEKSFELELMQEIKLGGKAAKLEKLIDYYNSNSENHLVEFVAYCLNPNHFHFVLIQKVDGGISEFMKRMGGYTSYFNEKYKRTGGLYGGRFKAVQVKDNAQLLHLSAYVNLNNQLGCQTPKLGNRLSKSSWGEYVGGNIDTDKSKKEKGICTKGIILEQFRSKEKYKDFALSSLEDIVKRKREEKEYEDLLME